MLKSSLNKFLFFILFSLGVFPCALASHPLPNLSAHSESVLSFSQERILGRKMMQEIRSHMSLMLDPITNEYIQHLGNNLLIAGPKTEFPFHFFIVNHSMVNAFAFFGGHIGIHTGLINQVETESELAAVMAHELGHIYQRHLARQILAQQKISHLTIAEILAAITIGAFGAPEASFHLITAALASHVQQQINFTRSHEKEADTISIRLLHQAGYDPQAAPNFFQKMGQLGRFHERGPEYLSTHPLYENRVSESRNRANQLAYRQKVDPLIFHLIKSRVNVLTSKDIYTTKETYQAQLKTGRYAHKAAAEYGLALSLLFQKKYPAARELLQKLEKAYPNEWIFQVSLAELYHYSGENAFMEQQLKKLYTTYPNSHSTLYWHGKHYLETNQPEKAIEWLKADIKKWPDEPETVDMLARAQGKSGQVLDSHISIAETLVLYGHFEDAKEQLELAMRLFKEKPDDYNKLKSTLEKITRLRDEQKSARVSPI